MGKISFFFCFLFFIAFDSYAQVWVQKATMPGGQGLDAPIYFSIGSKLYVGGGWNGSVALNTFYEYDPTTDFWTQKANIPAGIYSACCFDLNGKGYVVCGANPSLTNKVYQYDPTTNTWLVKSNFPNYARQNIIGFSCQGMGYLFGGFTGGTGVGTDLWQYNDVTDSWTQKASCPGPGRDGPTCLVINNQIFVGMGGNSSASSIYSDFYRYDPSLDSYTQVASSPIARDGPANFTVGNIGYVGMGYGYAGALSDFYKYDPLANTWTQTNNFGRTGTGNVFCATVGNLPYVGCGLNGSTGNYLIDNWTWQSCQLNLNLGRDTTICGASSFTLKDTTTNATHLWSTGATTASINVTTSGSYWVQTTQGTCVGRDTINVTFATAPQSFNIGNDTTYCGSFSRVLSTGNANTLWSTGVTASQITVTGPGLYWAQITSGCGSIRDSINISQNPIPAVDLGRDTNLCNTDPIILNATTGSASYIWQDGSSSPTLTVSSSGLYWVNITVNGCEASDSIYVSYISVGTFSLGSDTTYCGSFSRIISAGAANTIWNTGQVATTILIDSPGLYIGSIIVCGDTLRDSIIISQKSLPVVYLGNDTAVCQGLDLTLNAGNAGASYLWNDNSTAQTLTATPPGIYWVDVTVNGCTKRDSITASVLSPPSAFSLGNDTTICEDSSIVLNAYQANVHYIWSNGDTSSYITVNQSGQYQVTDYNHCGSYSASVSVSTKQCTCKVAIPTAFSPNGDGKNETFGLLTQCPLENYELNIYNRWGQKIFTSTSLQDKWDGSYKNTQQPLGVYVYFVHYKDPYTKEIISQAGNVTLLR